MFYYRLTKEDSCTELELAAVRAMSAVVCCGPVFDSNGLNDDGYIYHWLDTLLSSHDERVNMFYFYRRILQIQNLQKESQYIT